MDPTEEYLRNAYAVAVGRTVHPEATGMLQVHRSIELFGNSVGSVGFRAPATSLGPIYVLPASDSSVGTAVLVTDGSGNLGWATVSGISTTEITSTIGFSFDGASSVPEVNKAAFVRLPWAFTIQDVSILATPLGSIRFDLWATPFTSGQLPKRENSITGSAPPALVAANTYYAATLTGWTTSFASNMNFAANIDSISVVTWAVLELTVLRESSPGATSGSGGGSAVLRFIGAHGDGGVGATATEVGSRPYGGDYGGPYVCPP